MQPTLLHIETRTKFHFVQPPPYHCYIYTKPKKKKSLKIFLGMIDKFCCNFYCNTNQLDQTHVSGLLEVNLLACIQIDQTHHLDSFLVMCCCWANVAYLNKSSLVGKCKHVLQWLLSWWLKEQMGVLGSTQTERIFISF